MKYQKKNAQLAWENINHLNPLELVFANYVLRNVSCMAT